MSDEHRTGPDASTFRAPRRRDRASAVVAAASVAGVAVLCAGIALGDVTAGPGTQTQEPGDRGPVPGQGQSGPHARTGGS